MESYLVRLRNMMQRVAAVPKSRALIGAGILSPQHHSTWFGCAQFAGLFQLSRHNYLRRLLQDHGCILPETCMNVYWPSLYTSAHTTNCVFINSELHILFVIEIKPIESLVSGENDKIHWCSFCASESKACLSRLGKFIYSAIAHS